MANGILFSDEIKKKKVELIYIIPSFFFLPDMLMKPKQSSVMFF